MDKDVAMQIETRRRESDRDRGRDMERGAKWWTGRIRMREGV